MSITHHVSAETEGNRIHATMVISIGTCVKTALLVLTALLLLGELPFQVFSFLTGIVNSGSLNELHSKNDDQT